MSRNGEDAAEADLTPARRGTGLPGADRADDELIARAVHDLNAIYHAGSLETAMRMGQYVVDTFFGGDLDLARSGSADHVSYRRLAQHTDLRFSHSTISNCVRLLEQLRELPEELGHSLPFEHHKALLPLADTKVKTKLAKIGIEKNLTSREFHALVDKEKRRRAKGTRSGRRRDPDFLKAIRRVGKSLESVQQGEIGPDDLKRYEPDQVEGFVKTVDEQIAALQRIKQGLEAARASEG